jgi:HK97 family phage major capsid protein
MKGQTAIPETAEQMEELLNDDGRLAGLLTEPGKFGEFTQAYMVKAMESKKAELGQQMREEMQLGMQQFLQAQADGGYSPRGFKPGTTQLTARDVRRDRAITRSRVADAKHQVRVQGAFDDAAYGAVLDDAPYAESMRSFLYTMWKGEHVAKDQGDTARLEEIKGYKQALFNALTRPRNAGMAERLPSEGGYLVPEILRSEILMLSLETSVVRPRSTVIPMDSLRVPLPAIDDTSHASNVYGGVAAYWTAEGGTLAASAPKWGRVELEARKLTAYTTIPNELLQDAITPLDRWFNAFFPRAMAWFEDMAFINGNGTAEPQGFLNSPAAVKINSGTDYVVAFADIAAMYSRMWPASLGSAVWLCSPDVIASLLQMAASNVAPPLWLQGFQALGAPGGSKGDGQSYMLMGRPLIVSEKMPSSASGNTTTAGALSFVDLSYYLLGDRQSMQIATSEEYLFASDLVAYRVIQRMDGRIWQQSPITPANGSASTLSPVVLLNTPA